MTFAVRLLTVVLSRGGLSGYLGYDAGVYYASADALVHGRMPYADFVLLHPPGIMLVLSPIAWLGTIVGDHVAFVAATLLFQALAGCSAAMIYVLARRADLGRRGALVGAGFYAVWYGSIRTDVTTRLEPLGTVLFLAALVLLTGTPTVRRLAGAGALLGAAISVKLWWVVPGAIVAGVTLLRHRRRAERIGFATGAASVVLAVNLPFALYAPRAMWRMVVLDQLDRTAHRTPLQTRVTDLTTVHDALPHVHGAVIAAVVLGAAAVFVAVLATAWQAPGARLFVTVLLAQLVVLLVVPPYFPSYAGFPAGPLALVVGASAARRSDPARSARRWGFAASAAALAGAAAVCLATVTLRTPGSSQPFAASRLARGLDHVHCLMTNSAGALIELNLLSRSLDNGCPLWVDFNGRTYDVDAPTSHGQARTANAKWQRDARDYLLSGDAVLLVRTGSGFTERTLRQLEAGPVLVEADGRVVYSVVHRR